MSQLLCLSLDLPARITEPDVAEFEMVFSELLDSAAVSYQRNWAGEWVIEALFYDRPDLSIANALLAPLFEKQALTPLPLIITDLPERDWLAENRDAFPPRKIGRFWVYGRHIKQAPPAGSLPLLVDAALAFGSGTHPTTEGCLRALQMIPGTPPRRVLDMGCGSAILAMAAHRKWPAAMITAADKDPVAIRVTATNRWLNHIAPATMHLAVSHGFASRYVRQSAPYDVMFANILARPLMRMAPDLCLHLARRGWLILSGILNEEEVAVRNAYQAQTLCCWHRIRIGEWTTLVMRRATAGSIPYLWSGLCQKT
jgi:ribosomal protein L11 methyltransferase